MAYGSRNNNKTSEDFDKHLKLDDKLDSHSKPVKIGDDVTGLELSDTTVKTGKDLLVGGTLKLGGSMSNEYNNDLLIQTVPQGDVRIDAYDISLDTNTGYIYLKRQGSNYGIIEVSTTPRLKLSASASQTSYFELVGAGDGQLTINTVDAFSGSGDEGHIILDAAGEIRLNALNGSPVTMTNTGPDQFKIKYDLNNYALMNVSSSGDLEIETVGSGTTDSDITLNADGDIILDAAGGDIWANNQVIITSTTTNQFNVRYNGSNFTNFNVSSVGIFTIATDGGTSANADFIVDAGGDIALDSGTGVFIAKNAGTEFSAANSAYAGMILGYTDIGLNETAATYDLTTSYVVPTSEFSVSFKAPPSGNVEIMMQIGWDAGSSNVGDCFAGLSTSSSYSRLQYYHEKELFDAMSRGALRVIRHSWTITGLTAGASTEYWVGFKTSSTIGTPHLQWGADATGEYPDFIMKAIALPATITT